MQLCVDVFFWMYFMNMVEVLENQRGQTCQFCNFGKAIIY